MFVGVCVFNGFFQALTNYKIFDLYQIVQLGVDS